MKSVKQVKDRNLIRNVRENSKAAHNLLNAGKKEVCGLRDTRSKKRTLEIAKACGNSGHLQFG